MCVSEVYNINSNSYGVAFLGIMTDIKSQFEITDEKAGLLQTVFVISYMLFAPLFGYLGDRYSRRLLMASGVFLWGLTTLAGSFMNVSTFDYM